MAETVGLVGTIANDGESERPGKLVWETRIQTKRGRGKPTETWDSMMMKKGRYGTWQRKWRIIEDKGENLCIYMYI